MIYLLTFIALCVTTGYVWFNFLDPFQREYTRVLIEKNADLLWTMFSIFLAGLALTYVVYFFGVEG